MRLLQIYIFLWPHNYEIKVRAISVFRLTILPFQPPPLISTQLWILLAQTKTQNFEIFNMKDQEVDLLTDRYIQAGARKNMERP